MSVLSLGVARVGPQERISDDALMLSVQRGQAGLFAEIFRRYRDPVYNYLRRMTGDDDRAQELTQEVFLHALRASRTYKADGRFRAWLYRIATNLARTEHARKTTETDGLERLRHEASGFHDDGGRLGDGLETDERKAIVHEALMRLSERERSVVVLRHYQDMKFREIAEVLDLNEATVKSRMRYALEKLSRHLAPYIGKI